MGLGSMYMLLGPFVFMRVQNVRCTKCIEYKVHKTEIGYVTYKVLRNIIFVSVNSR